MISAFAILTFIVLFLRTSTVRSFALQPVSVSRTLAARHKSTRLVRYGQPIVSSGYSNNNIPSADNYVRASIWLGVGTFVIPYLISLISDPGIDGSQRQLLFIGLLVFKRVVLYAIGTSTVEIASKRSDSVSGLGQRFQNLNSELFGLNILGKDDNDLQIEASVYKKMDEIGEKSQAALLPIIISTALVISLLFLNFTKQPAVMSFENVEILKGLAVLPSVAVCFLFLRAELSAAATSLTGATTESTLPPGERDEQKGTIGLSPLPTAQSVLVSVLAAAVTIGAFLGPANSAGWALGNAVNMSIAITMARLFQLQELLPIFLALMFLTLYDVIAVIGTQHLTDGGASIMEAVAMSKLNVVSTNAAGSAVDSTALSSALSSAGNAAVEGFRGGTALESRAGFEITLGAQLDASIHNMKSAFNSVWGLVKGSTWRPGLFEVNVGGRVSDALGLGDAVFPAILAGWSWRYDKSRSNLAGPVQVDSRRAFAGGKEDPHQSEREGGNTSIESGNKSKERGTPIYNAALVGYVAGCFYCESSQAGVGQPALAYIVPVMIAAVLSAGAARGELTDMWAANGRGGDGGDGYSDGYSISDGVALSVDGVDDDSGSNSGGGGVVGDDSGGFFGGLFDGFFGGNSVGDSVGDSVCDSVGDSGGYSGGYSGGDFGGGDFGGGDFGGDCSGGD